MTPALDTWGGTSRTVDLDGPVHYVDFGGPADGPRVVFVHGLGGSHLNWCLTAERLRPVARVLALDLAGFGLSHPAGRRTTVSANAALLDHAVPEDLVAASVALAEERRGVPGLEAAFLSAARSLMGVLTRRGRYFEAMRSITSPVLLLHGEEDRLVSVHAARAAASRNPAWRFEVLPGVGHVPQLEAPEATVDLVLDWLDREGVGTAPGDRR